MSEHVWRAMFTAPKDGTKIIAIGSPRPGMAYLSIIWWSEPEEGSDEPAGWWDGHLQSLTEEREFGGWIPVPEGTPGGYVTFDESGTEHVQEV